jgi:hypothetical protein
MFDETIVITLKTGEIYAGLVDECFYNGGWVVALYSCKLLHRTSQRWIDHAIFGTFEGRKIRDPLPEFWISEIRRVEVLSEDLQENVDFEDALQFYVDPHYKPLPHVKCNWDDEGSGKPHDANCESRLHEALSFLLKRSLASISLSKEERESLQDRIDQSFRLVRRRLLVTGARIP